MARYVELRTGVLEREEWEKGSAEGGWIWIGRGFRGGEEGDLELGGKG